VIYGCKFFLPHLMEQDEAHIANISSIQGLMALNSQTSYVASKFAVRGFGESLRGELRPHRIGVTTVYPGLVNTNVVNASRAAGEKGEELKGWTADFFARFALAPEKCARRIVWAIERNKARMLITPESHIADWLKRLLPAGTDTVASRLQHMRRTNA
jgi:short-subunit dehydrogenase